MTENKKIVWLSDSPFLNTGYSTQSLFLLNKLSKLGYDIHYFAHSYTGQDLPKGGVTLKDGTKFEFNVYGCAREPYCKDVIIPKIQEIKPDYYITLLDTFMLFPWYLQQNFAPAKTFFWFPSDGGGGMPLGCEQVLMKCNHPVAMSKYAQKQVKEYYNINAHYIPHAVDHELFKPLSEEQRQQLKQKYNLSGKFVVGVIGRNQGRKMHDRVFKAFAKWCRNHEDAILLVHYDPIDNAAVFDTIKLIQLLHIENRVRFTGTKFYSGFSYQQMNEVYNVMDIYFSTSSGEGFGVCTIEAASCGIPIVITSYTTSDELVREHECGEIVKLVGCEDINILQESIPIADRKMDNGTITGSWTVERGIVDIDDCCNKLEKLYNDTELRKKYGERGRRAVIDNYTWDIVTKKWDELLQKQMELPGLN